MRHLFFRAATAVTLAFAFANPLPAQAESVMSACAGQWKQVQAAGGAGQTWPQFLAQCRTRLGSAAPPSGTVAPAPAPAPPAQSGSLFPWWQPAAPSSTPAATAAGEYSTELQARARCPSDTVVWVNLRTRIYHHAGTHNYGHTRQGAYMCEAEARAAGNRAARTRERAGTAPSG